MNYSILDLKVDEKRIYGTGLSMGGFGILELALKVPSLFTAIVAICGGTITNDLSGLETPTWLFHGEEDDVIPVESSLLIYKHLKEKIKIFILLLIQILCMILGRKLMKIKKFMIGC